MKQFSTIASYLEDLLVLMPVSPNIPAPNVTAPNTTADGVHLLGEDHEDPPHAFSTPHHPDPPRISLDPPPTPLDLPHTPIDPPRTPLTPLTLNTTPTLPSEAASSCTDELMPESAVMKIRANSCSRENFASKLVRTVFTTEERRNSNVSGRCGRTKLDEKRVHQVRELAFRLYPLGASESESRSWATCVRAIDTANRQLRKTKEN